MMLIDQHSTNCLDSAARRLLFCIAALDPTSNSLTVQFIGTRSLGVDSH
jgi:hypothetical protein